MTLFFFKYFLPILLGYTIFVGIAGQYAPFIRPKVTKKRPLWFLGLWVGMAISVMTIIGLRQAYRMELNDLTSLTIPGIAMISAVLLPGIILFFWYRWLVNRQTPVGTEPQTLISADSDDSTQLDKTMTSTAPINHELDDTVTVESTDVHQITWIQDEDSPDMSEMDETLFFDGKPSEYNESLIVNVETEILADTDINTAAETAAEAEAETETETEAETETETETEAETAPQTESESVTEINTETAEEIAYELCGAESNSESFDSEVEAEQRVPAFDDQQATAHETAELTACRQEIIRLRNELETEIDFRSELETHLRITRKGLGALESESREFELNKASALIKIERELEDKIKRLSAAEARADREMSKRAELENEMLLLREDTLKAANDCRVSTEARASALNTANKATTFARQAMQIRARLESQLSDVKEELENKQATISSLIKALEKEKSRTQEDVTLMAKQLRLQEKQLQARRTLEKVSRTVDNKLSTRLVKKVAKSRS